MAQIALWLGLTALWLILLLAVTPLMAYGRWSARILGLPDFGDPLIGRMFARVVASVGLLVCAAGAVAAVVQRFG
jgi:hypothetical protein